MTIPETTLIYVGIPVAVTAVIAVLSVFTAEKKSRPADYRLGDEWSHAPLLWTAVDETAVAAQGQHSHQAHGGHTDPAELIGGRASGTF